MEDNDPQETDENTVTSSVDKGMIESQALPSNIYKKQLFAAMQISNLTVPSFLVKLYPKIFNLLIYPKSGCSKKESFLLIESAGCPQPPGHASHHVRVMVPAPQIAANGEKWSQLSPDTQGDPGITE